MCTLCRGWAATNRIFLVRSCAEGCLEMNTQECGQYQDVELWQKTLHFKTGCCFRWLFLRFPLISLALFALCLSTLRLWIYLESRFFCGDVWDSTFYTSEKLLFDEHFFQEEHQRKHPLISPSPLPLLTHPSAVPVSVLCGKQITEHIQVKNSWKREREREINSRTWTNILYIHPKPIQQNVFSSDFICLSSSINNLYLISHRTKGRNFNSCWFPL